MNAYIKVYFKSVFKWLWFLLWFFVVFWIVGWLNIDVNINSTLNSFIKRMYFTSNGQSPIDDSIPNENNNTSLLVDWESWSIDMVGAVNIQEWKLKDWVIITQDIKDFTINTQNIWNNQINNRVLEDNSIDSSKISPWNINSSNIKDNWVYPQDINSSGTFKFNEIFDSNNPLYYSNLSSLTNFNSINWTSFESISISRINSWLWVLTWHSSQWVTVNWTVKSSWDLCRNFTHPIYGKQDRYCLGQDPLELWEMREWWRCKVTWNKINCNHNMPYTFTWEYWDWWSCSVTQPILSDWNTCTKTCWWWTQSRTCSTNVWSVTRNAKCIRQPDNKVVPTSYCESYAWTINNTKTCSVDCTWIALTQSCNTQACCNVTSWSPDPSTVCSHKTLTQTSNCWTTRTVQWTKLWTTLAAQSIAASKAWWVVTYNSPTFDNPIEISWSVFTEDLLYWVYCYDKDWNMTYKNVWWKWRDSDDRIDYAYYSCVANRIYIKVQEWGWVWSDRMWYTVNWKYCE